MWCWEHLLTTFCVLLKHGKICGLSVLLISVKMANGYEYDHQILIIIQSTPDYSDILKLEDVV